MTQKEKAINLDDKSPQSEESRISTSVLDSFQAINEAVDFLTSLKINDSFVLLQFLEVGRSVQCGLIVVGSC